MSVPVKKQTFALMILEAIKELNERNGSSKQAIAKFITARHDIDFKASALQNKRFKLALVGAVTAGDLKQVKGTGANGSFKIVGQRKVAKKDAAKKRAKTDTRSTVSQPTPVAKKVVTKAATVAKKVVAPTKKVAVDKPKLTKRDSKNNFCRSNGRSRVAQKASSN